MDHVIATLEKAKTLIGQGKPIGIMMHTVMGKGVDFMEGSHEWHGIAPNDEQLAKAGKDKGFARKFKGTGQAPIIDPDTPRDLHDLALASGCAREGAVQV